MSKYHATKTTLVINNYDTGGCCNYCKVEVSEGCMYQCYDGVKNWLESECEK